MTESAYILEGSRENFDRLVLENSKRGLVVVDFWAPWAGPSLRQQEILSDLAKNYDGRFLLVTV
ncbi:MAG: thioredoxin domain-containing protein, partial [Candidatus Thiodiazotropha sp. 6PDIVS]